MIYSRGILYTLILVAAAVITIDVQAETFCIKDSFYALIEKDRVDGGSFTACAGVANDSSTTYVWHASGSTE